jgi:hypothetical protein
MRQMATSRSKAENTANTMAKVATAEMEIRHHFKFIVILGFFYYVVYVVNTCFTIYTRMEHPYDWLPGFDPRPYGICRG